MFGVLFLKTCESCDSREERVFTDSWTGKDLCPMCLSRIINQVTMSPASEGDNLPELLDKEDEDASAWVHADKSEPWD